MSLSASSCKLRQLVELVATLSLILSFAYGAAAHVPDAEVNNLLDGHVFSLISDCTDCGAVGAGYSGCVAHAGCLAFATPPSQLLVANSSAMQWLWPDTRNRSGHSILPPTPPPRTIV